MARKLKLKIDYFDEYHMLAIVSHLKDYRLAYHINQKLGSHLKKFDDLVIRNGDEQNYTWYCCHEKENHMRVYLIGNSAKGSKLIPSRKEIDFFLLIKNAINTEKVEHILKEIRSIPDIVGVFNQEMASIKDMDVLLELIELHELEQFKGKQKR
jgi:hypothetical protein